MQSKLLLTIFFPVIFASVCLSAEAMESANYTIEQQRVGAVSLNTLSSPSYTLTPGPSFTSETESTPGAGSRGGSKTGSRLVEEKPGETVFIGDTIQTLVPNNPQAIPLLGAEAKPGVVSGESLKQSDEPGISPEKTVVSAPKNRMWASVVESGTALFDARVPRLGVFFFILAFLFYIRTRTSWGRRYLPF